MKALQVRALGFLLALVAACRRAFSARRVSNALYRPL